MTPWSTTKSFSTVRVPTIIFGAENDTVAPVVVALDSVLHEPAGLARQGVRGAQRRQPFRAEQHQHADRPLLGVVGQALHGQRHCATSTFLCGAPHTAFATPTVFSDYRSTCPY